MDKKLPHASGPRLRRALGLPLLVLYGVGVTVGAGIFALIGQVSGLAGGHAPLAFLIAGAVAAATGYSYALLAAAFPRAGGEAVFTHIGLGRMVATATGFGVLATAIISSAVIALAFAGYVSEVASLPRPLLAAGAVLALAALAAWGVRESVLFAAAVTLLETATLILIIATGLPYLDAQAAQRIFTLPAAGEWTGVLAAAFLAFFAFIGFEDIENMAEETREPERMLPQAIFLTLAATVVIYGLVAAVAVSVPGNAQIAGHEAPLARLFELATGLSGKPVAAMAAIAMVNGILVQIVMASRLVYGMAREGLLPAAMGKVNARTQTPLAAIAVVAGLIILLAAAFPLGGLAEATSAVILGVFAAVNIAFWRIGTRPDAPPSIARMRYWGLFAAALCLALLALELKG